MEDIKLSDVIDGSKPVVWDHVKQLVANELSIGDSIFDLKLAMHTLFGLTDAQLVVYMCSKEALALVKRTILDHRKDFRNIFVRGFGKLLLKVWILLHQSIDIEGYVRVESSSEARRIKEDFVDSTVDVFKSFALGAVGKALSSEPGVLFDDDIVMSNAYCTVLADLFESYNCDAGGGSGGVIDDWVDALLGLTGSTSRAETEKLRSLSENRSETLLKLMKVCLKIVLVDNPGVLASRCTSLPVYANAAQRLTSTVYMTILTECDATTSPTAELELQDSDRRGGGGLALFNVSKEINVDEATANSRSGDASVPLLPLLSQWVEGHLMSLLASSVSIDDMCALIKTVIVLTQHQYLHASRVKVATQVVERLVYLLEIAVPPDDTEQLAYADSVCSAHSTSEIIAWVLLLLRDSTSYNTEYIKRLCNVIYRIPDVVTQTKLVAELCVVTIESYVDALCNNRTSDSSASSAIAATTTTTTMTAVSVYLNEVSTMNDKVVSTRFLAALCRVSHQLLKSEVVTQTEKTEKFAVFKQNAWDIMSLRSNAGQQRSHVNKMVLMLTHFDHAMKIMGHCYAALESYDSSILSSAVLELTQLLAALLLPLSCHNYQDVNTSTESFNSCPILSLCSTISGDTYSSPTFASVLQRMGEDVSTILDNQLFKCTVELTSSGYEDGSSSGISSSDGKNVYKRLSSMHSLQVCSLAVSYSLTLSCAPMNPSSSPSSSHRKPVDVVSVAVEAACSSVMDRVCALLLVCKGEVYQTATLHMQWKQFRERALGPSSFLGGGGYGTVPTAGSHDTFTANHTAAGSGTSSSSSMQADYKESFYDLCVFALRGNGTGNATTMHFSAQQSRQFHALELLVHIARVLTSQCCHKNRTGRVTTEEESHCETKSANEAETTTEDNRAEALCQGLRFDAARRCVCMILQTVYAFQADMYQTAIAAVRMGTNVGRISGNAVLSLSTATNDFLSMNSALRDKLESSIASLNVMLDRLTARTVALFILQDDTLKKINSIAPSVAVAGTATATATGASDVKATADSVRRQQEKIVEKCTSAAVRQAAHSAQLAKQELLLCHQVPQLYARSDLLGALINASSAAQSLYKESAITNQSSAAAIADISNQNGNNAAKTLLLHTQSQQYSIAPSLPAMSFAVDSSTVYSDDGGTRADGITISTHRQYGHYNENDFKDRGAPRGSLKVTTSSESLHSLVSSSAASTTTSAAVGPGGAFTDPTTPTLQAGASFAASSMTLVPGLLDMSKISSSPAAVTAASSSFSIGQMVIPQLPPAPSPAASGGGGDVDDLLSLDFSSTPANTQGPSSKSIGNGIMDDLLGMDSIPNGVVVPTSIGGGSLDVGTQDLFSEAETLLPKLKNKVSTEGRITTVEFISQLLRPASYLVNLMTGCGSLCDCNGSISLFATTPSSQKAGSSFASPEYNTADLLALVDDVISTHVVSAANRTDVAAIQSVKEQAVLYTASELKHPTELDWMCISGSSDLLTVLCHIRKDEMMGGGGGSGSGGSTFTITIRVYNSSGFKVPSFFLQLLTEHVSSSASIGGSTDVTEAPGVDYFLPGAFIERQFTHHIYNKNVSSVDSSSSSLVSCRGGVTFVVRILYNELQYDDEDNFDIPLEALQKLQKHYGKSSSIGSSSTSLWCDSDSDREEEGGGAEEEHGQPLSRSSTGQSAAAAAQRRRTIHNNHGGNRQAQLYRLNASDGLGFGLRPSILPASGGGGGGSGEEVGAGGNNSAPIVGLSSGGRWTAAVDCVAVRVPASIDGWLPYGAGSLSALRHWHAQQQQRQLSLESAIGAAAATAKGGVCLCGIPLTVFLAQWRRLGPLHTVHRTVVTSSNNNDKNRSSNSNSSRLCAAPVEALKQWIAVGSSSRNTVWGSSELANNSSDGTINCVNSGCTLLGLDCMVDTTSIPDAATITQEEVPYVAWCLQRQSQCGDVGVIAARIEPLFNTCGSGDDDGDGDTDNRWRGKLTVRCSNALLSAALSAERQDLQLLLHALTHGFFELE